MFFPLALLLHLALGWLASLRECGGGAPTLTSPGPIWLTPEPGSTIVQSHPTPITVAAPPSPQTARRIRSPPKRPRVDRPSAFSLKMRVVSQTSLEGSWVRAPHSARTSTPRKGRAIASPFELSDGRANVRAGRVDPVFYEIERAASKRFWPSWKVIGREGKGMQRVRRVLGRIVRAFIASYRQRLDAYGKAQAKTRPGDTADDQIAPWRWATADGGQTIALVCLVYRADRRWAVRLAGASGVPAFDRQARRALERAALSPALTRYDQPVEVCYRFRATVNRVPPLPIVGCSFDEVALSARCYYPLKRLIKLAVELWSAH
ncbi:MAG: hypothetical protein H6707_03575 [Deltaproteobacteria bacterium]|nr:hypothetical protein [Deltaproteobacteria bacterium]